MDPNSSPDNPLSNLQFTTNETVVPTASAGGLTCVGCKRPIESTYFALADQVICPGCRDQVTAKPTGNGFVRFLKAAVFGIVAGLIGALIWYLIRVLANLQIGLIAILVGFMVGKAIHMATGGRGGLKYQLLAVLVTYSCIAVNYAPDILQALIAASREDAREANATAALPGKNEAAEDPNSRAEPVPVANNEPGAAKPADATPAGDGAAAKEKLTGVQLLVGVVLIGMVTLALSLAAPIMLGMESPIGLLIVGFALWEAWKFSGHKPLPITGPYQIGQPGAPTSTPAPVL